MKNRSAREQEQWDKIEAAHGKADKILLAFLAGLIVWALCKMFEVF
jgi:hypothetical protein